MLRLYYTNNIVLFLVCAGDQLFFIALYLLSAGVGVPWVTGLLYVSAPVCGFKQWMNVVQLVGSATELAKMDQISKSKGKFKAK